MINLLQTDNPYKVLGVERNAAPDEIKRAYFALVREHPPERDPDGFKRIRAAYDKLKGAERTQTDLFLIEDRESPVAMAIQRYSAEPQPLTPEIIRADLLAVEAEFLLDELRKLPVN